MRLLLAYLFFGIGGILVQTALAPLLLKGNLAPELLLILVIHLGLYQQGFGGGLTAYALGLLQDSFAGTCLGLYGLIFLTLYLILRGLAERLNTESPVLLFFMVMCGTLLQAFMLVFLLAFLADAGPTWINILGILPLQLVVNLASAWLLLNILHLLRKNKRVRIGAKAL